jgi:hypothetical protein
MSASPSPKNAPASSSAPIASAAEAGELTAQFVEVMDALVAIVQRETELVRAGHLAKAAELEATKGDLARRYIADTLRLRASQAQLARIVPADKLAALRQRHDTFRALLQINLTVLATAHAVSEGIVRGVSGEMARKSTPQTYGASGRANVPSRSAAAPIAISRVL